jgi:lipopolysaccharide/colanic/teichoic acid biosynthesis glycosyltransferase
MLLKRALDVTLGTAALVLALPLIVLGAVAVRLVGRGPAFFSQEREGYLGVSIRIWKLRTMYVDAERRLADHLQRDPKARREWESKYKLSHDPRVLPLVGSLLRRFSIDELPQLWHVVRGEMSLVGPRPFPAYHLERFPHGFRLLRQRLRPGITGLWQVMVRSDGGLEEQQAYDTFYIRNWSLWMDLYVLARTMTAVFGGRGAY